MRRLQFTLTLLLCTLSIVSSEKDCEKDGSCKLTVDQMWDVFGCDEIFEQARPVHNQSTWALMRGVYTGVVKQKSTIAPLSHASGLLVPFEVQQSHKGRGLYATAPVKKGTLVWTPKKQSACFSSGDEYRAFLYHIPVDCACDVIQWAYVKSFGPNKKKDAMICADLDEGSFMNGDYDGGDSANLGCVDGTESCKQTLDLTALRDIETGEEFICAYGDFAISSGWKWFGL